VQNNYAPPNLAAQPYYSGQGQQPASAPGVQAAPISFMQPVGFTQPVMLLGMAQVTSLTWTGPIDQVTRTLTEMGGYTFQVSGAAPPIPLVVSVEAHQEQLGKILYDIGLQAGRRADLLIDHDKRLLTLRYAPTPGLVQY
jgi:hypothetical protein